MCIPVDELMRVFDLYDQERVDSVPITALPHILRSCGMFCTHTEMDALLREHFPSGDTVTCVAFATFLQKNPFKAEDFLSQVDLAVALHAFDPRNKGMLTTNEALTILTRMNESIDVNRYHDVMEDLELEATDMVDCDRLAAHMLRSAEKYKLSPAQVLNELVG